MQTNYVLIDLENIQPKSLKHLAHDHFKIIVFVGARQTNLPLEMATSLQPLSHRVQYIQISGNGRNALDFHIAYYIGRLAVADPTAHFHVLSKDTGFDPLIHHLKGKNVFARRVNAVSEIPIVKISISKAVAEHIDAVVAKLCQLKASKPGTVKALSSTISALLKHLSDEEVSGLVQELTKKQYVMVSSKKIKYALPAEC